MIFLLVEAWNLKNFRENYLLPFIIYRVATSQLQEGFTSLIKLVVCIGGDISFKKQKKKFQTKTMKSHLYKNFIGSTEL